MTSQPKDEKSRSPARKAKKVQNARESRAGIITAGNLTPEVKNLAPEVKEEETEDQEAVFLQPPKWNRGKAQPKFQRKPKGRETPMYEGGDSKKGPMNNFRSMKTRLNDSRISS